MKTRLSPFQPLLERIQKNLLANPSAVILEVDGVHCMAQELLAEWALVTRLLDASFSGSTEGARGLLVGERGCKWVAGWLGALEKGVPWLILSDYLPQGMIRLLEKSWQPSLCLGSCALPEHKHLPNRAEPWVWANFSRPSAPLNVCTHQDFARRQLVWEHWLEGSGVGRVGWWLPCQHSDMPEVALHHLSRGACLVHDVDERAQKFWGLTKESAPSLSPKGFTHLHLTAIQAANTIWSQADANLKCWVHGPCPDWILGLHPGLERSPLPVPTSHTEPILWSTEDQSLLEIFEIGLVEVDEKASQRIVLEEVVGQIYGVVACAWLEGKRGRVMKVWVAPGVNRGWVGANCQLRIREAFPELEMDWHVRPFLDLSTDIKGEVELERVFMDMHALD